tara:strand:- start:388 stop:1113 length:726 start_codon:yes stop_codon:yes gene_type:complete
MTAFFKNIYNLFNLIYKKNKSKKYYYSFGGIDIIVDYIFKNKSDGFYIDIGCQHPISNNNTYLLHKRGWSGINVDLDKKNIELFNLHRKKDYNVEIAVSSKNTQKELFFYHDKSPINTLEKRVRDHRETKEKEIRKINTVTLNSLIESSPFRNSKFNFLTIDVEGHELEVIKGFDLKKYEPEIIVIEHLDLSTKKLEIKNLNINNVINSDLYKLMSNNNYSFVNWSHADLVFVNNKFRDKN